MHLQSKGRQKTPRHSSSETPQGSVSHLDQTGRGTGSRGGTPANGVGPGKAWFCPCCHVSVLYSSLRRKHRGSAQPTRGRPGCCYLGLGQGQGVALGPPFLVPAPPCVLLKWSRLILPSLFLAPPTRSLLIFVCFSCLRPSSTPSSASASLFLLQCPLCPTHTRTHTHDTVYIYIYTQHIRTHNTHSTHYIHTLHTHCTHSTQYTHTTHSQQRLFTHIHTAHTHT